MEAPPAEMEKDRHSLVQLSRAFACVWGGESQSCAGMKQAEKAPLLKTWTIS